MPPRSASKPCGLATEAPHRRHQQPGEALGIVTRGGQVRLDRRWRLAGTGLPGRGRAARGGRPGPRAAVPGRGQPAIGSYDRTRAGWVGRARIRPGRASPHGRGHGVGGCPARSGQTQWCQPPPPVATSGPGSWRPPASCSWRRADRPVGPSMSRASKTIPVASPTLAWGQRRHQRPKRSESVVDSLTPWRTRDEQLPAQGRPASELAAADQATRRGHGDRALHCPWTLTQRHWD
jgi:hypothetical protein